MLRGWCQRTVDGTILGVILFSFSENSVLIDDISENILNEELNKLLLVKIHALIKSQRELEPQRRQLLEANQIKLSVRENIWCSRLGMKDHLHWESYAGSCREIEELKRRCYQEENTKNNEDWNNFLCNMIRNPEHWVYYSTILTHRAVMTYLRSSSSSCYLEFKIA